MRRCISALSVKTLAMMRCAGTRPQFVKRGRVFYYREDLDEWLRAGRAASTAQVTQRRPRASEPSGYQVRGLKRP